MGGWKKQCLFVIVLSSFSPACSKWSSAGWKFVKKLCMHGCVCMVVMHGCVCMVVYAWLCMHGCVFLVLVYTCSH